ncbi:MAG TPA: hypothetical protein VMW41_03690 [Candidatus Bathyarchaeia archaeon]|nr:hypothetical protein [Candidatus Bathyarchaeia archaeon]
MKRDINLFIAAKQPENQVGLNPLLRKGLVFLMVFYILFLTGVFSLSFFFSRKEEILSAEIEKKERQIEKQARIETLQLTVKSRLSVIKDIFDREKGKISVSQSLERIKNLTGDKIIITGIELSDFGSQANLRASVSQVGDLIDFFQGLKTAKEGLENFSLTQLNKDEKGYNFVLVFKFKG